jgi:hypothetical protein
MAGNRRERPVTEPIVGYFAGRTNAALLRYAMRLWWRSEDRTILDPTHGRGVWCSVFPPECLTCHDLAQDSVDYRYPIDEPGSADLILFDPDYVSVGSYQTSTMPEHHDRYGMRLVGWKECFSDVATGIAVQAKLLKPTGRLWTRTQIFTESGRKHNGLANVYNAGDDAGLEFLGQIFHHRGAGRNPNHKRQLTVREVGSFLICFGGPEARGYLARTTPTPRRRRLSNGLLFQ